MLKNSPFRCKLHGSTEFILSNAEGLTMKVQD